MKTIQKNQQEWFSDGPFDAWEDAAFFVFSLRLALRELEQKNRPRKAIRREPKREVEKRKSLALCIQTKSYPGRAKTRGTL